MVKESKQSKREGVRVPVIGTITLPEAEGLAYYAALAGLAVAGMVDWPIVAAIGIGHILVANRNGNHHDERA